MTTWWLGTIGFGYKDWKGSFYPPDLRAQDYLTYYSRNFNAVELDTTFYGAPTMERVQQWKSSAPEIFRFCAKTPRKITHEMGLVGVQGIMEDFVSTLTGLGNLLGVILIQLPPSFKSDSRRILENFLKELPRDVRYAVELRHPSWYEKQTEDLLSSLGVSWVSLEFPRLPMEIQLTSDFLYLRWIGQHGSFERHTHERIDKTAQLIWWKEQIDLVSHQVKDIFGFFNNDYAGFAAGTCLKFKELVGLPVQKPPEEKQARLF